MSDVVCLDAGIWIKALVAEELSGVAADLVEDAIASGSLVEPAFCWAEVGSVLRKKVRVGELRADEADEAWNDFQAMPIAFIDTPRLRNRAWDLAARYGQPTLYDAAYLACAESSGATFWTADAALVTALGSGRPAYVRQLSEAVHPGAARG